MTEIGAEAGVTGPNLYSYFASKADLLRAVVERATHAVWIDLDAALAAHRRPRSALPAVVAGYIRIAGGWSANGVDLSGEPGIAALSRSYRREYVAEWVELTAASRSETGQPMARALVHIALSLIDELSRTPHLATAPGFRANLAAMTQSVLLARV
jgi:AcrR family transcriptional regulator